MKFLVITILFFSSLGGCEKTAIVGDEINGLAMIQAEQLANFDCLNQQADDPIPVATAKSRLPGTWQLKAIFSMIPSEKIPNIVLKIDEDYTVTVTQAGKVVHTDKLTVSDKKNNTFNLLTIESSRKEFINGDVNFLYGGLRICEKEMLIDNGMAFDALGYYFRRK